MKAKRGLRAQPMRTREDDGAHLGRLWTVVRLFTILIILGGISSGSALAATFALPAVPEHIIDLPPAPPLKLGQKIAPEPPSTGEHQPGNNNGTANEARSARQPPSASGPGIQDAPAVKPEAESINQAKDDQDERTSHGLLSPILTWGADLLDFLNVRATPINAIATIFIAAFTGTLWWASRTQGRLLGRSIKAAQDSADAALLQAKIIAGAESGRLDFDFTLGEPEAGATDIGTLMKVGPGAPPDECYVRVGVRNIGNTPLRVTQLYVNWAVEKVLPEEPVYGDVRSFNDMIHPNKVLCYTVTNARIELESKLRIRFADGAALWIYGFITYEDFIADLYDIGFAAFWESGRPGLGREPARGFVTQGAPPAYYYKTKRQPDQPKSGPPPKLIAKV